MEKHAEKYTVVDTDGEVLDRHLDPAEAAHEILSYDSGEWRIDGEAEGWRLVTRKQCANDDWSATVIFSLEPAFSDATNDIFEQVIKADWPRHPEAILDSVYDAGVEALARDDAAWPAAWPTARVERRG